MGVAGVRKHQWEFLRGYLLLLTPPVIMQELTVYFFTHGFLDIYFTFSGWRLPVLLASFIFGGYLLSRITNSERLKLFTVAAVILTFLVRYYFVCDLFECYYLQDAFQLVRLGMLMAGLALIGDSIGVKRRYRRSNLPISEPRKYLLAASVVYVLSYFPLETEFAGLSGFPELGEARFLYTLLFVPLASGLAALNLISDRVRAFASYLTAMILTILSFSPLPCDGCGATANLLVVNSLVSVVAGLIAVFVAPRIFDLLSLDRGGSANTFRWLSRPIIILLIVSLPLTIVASFRGASPGLLSGNGLFGSEATPYVGAYDAIPYIPSCCVAATIVLSVTNQSVIDASNQLRAGIGVQAPNRYVDGLDYGYRLDVLYSGTGKAWVEANAWQICDVNLACGGVPWQNHLYSSVYNLDFSPGNLTLNLSMSMNSSRREAVWYMNDTVVGAFHLPKISLASFSTGVLPFGNPTWLNFPYGEADFLQFGIASSYPIHRGGWSVTILNPSYNDHGQWRIIGHANVIQGTTSFWKVLWLWGGETYGGVSVTGLTSPSLGVKFSYSGTTTPDRNILW